MGHDISTYTSSGEKIPGPHFSRYWCPHYDYLDATQHNAGISGDGESMNVTPEQLRKALHEVNEALFHVQDICEKLREAYATSDNKEEKTKISRNAQWDYIEMKTLDELSEFLKDCIAENVTAICFS